jgi:hypothetical protein
MLMAEVAPESMRIPLHPSTRLLPWPVAGTCRPTRANRRWSKKVSQNSEGPPGWANTRSAARGFEINGESEIRRWECQTATEGRMIFFRFSGFRLILFNLLVVTSKAYGLSLGCSIAPIKLRIGSWIRTSRRRHGVEPKGSVPLWKRRGVACLAPDHVGHVTRGPLGGPGLSRGVTPGLMQGSAACKPYNENSNAILESASRRKNAKMVEEGVLA